jgi:hypothetical protein
VGQAPPYEWAQLRQTNPIQPGWPAGWVPARGNRAKRTQSRHVARASCPWIRIMGARAHATIPAGEIPHRSTVLSFHHSKPMPIVQNEPNLAGRAGSRRAKCAKQSQTWAGWGIWGPARGKPIVQNEANFAGSLKCKVSSVKSGKPGVEPWESSYFRLYTSLGRRPFVQNEANSPGGARWDGVWRTRIVEDNRAKRSQFGQTGNQDRSLESENAQNKPNLPGGAGRPSLAPRPSGLAPAEPILRNKANSPPPGTVSGEDAQPTKSRLRQTKPNLGRMGYLGGASGRHKVQNEANWGQPAWHPDANYAKRTQFPDCGLETDLPLRPVWADCAKRTQSARRGRVARGGKPGGRRANAQNEPNFGGSGQESDANGAKRSQFLDCGLQIAQNEPNSPAGARWDGVWGTRIVEGNCAKRSQFAAHRWNEAAGTRAGRTVPGRIDNWR